MIIGLIPTCLDLLHIISLSELQEQGWCFKKPSGTGGVWYLGFATFTTFTFQILLLGGCGVSACTVSARRYVEVLDFYSSALFRIDWLVILEIMPTVIGIAASASLLMLLGKKNVQWVWWQPVFLKKFQIVEGSEIAEQKRKLRARLTGKHRIEFPQLAIETVLVSVQDQ